MDANTFYHINDGDAGRLHKSVEIQDDAYAYGRQYASEQRVPVYLYIVERAPGAERGQKRLLYQINPD